MSKRDVTEVMDGVQQEFEAPALTVIGDAGDVVLGFPLGGWDHRGLTAPSFEFESDEE